MQEALLAAATQWPRDGLPANPAGWLVTVAGRRLTDELRSRRAPAGGGRSPTRSPPAPTPGWRPGTGRANDDDSLTLLFLCCHPALSPPSQVALTLRAVGGLTTAEVASAFLVPEATDRPADQPGQGHHRRGGRHLRPAAARRARRPGGRGAPGPVPGVQRGLRGHLRRRAACGSTSRPRPSASPARRAGCCPTTPRWRACSPSCCSPRPGARPAPARRRPRPPRRAGPLAVGRRPDRRGRRPHHRHPAPGAGRAVPGAGRHRRRPRRGADLGRHRLAAGPRPLRRAGADRAQPAGHAQPGGGAGRGRRPAGGPRPAGHPRRRPPDGAEPPAAGRPRPPAGAGGRHRRRRSSPTGRRPDSP